MTLPSRDVLPKPRRRRSSVTAGSQPPLHCKTARQRALFVGRVFFRSLSTHSNFFAEGNYPLCLVSVFHIYFFFMKRILPE